MLISVHIPKTAGSSFALSLKERYGASCRSDYLDFPFSGETPFDRKTKAVCSALQTQSGDYGDVDCIHGHFLAFKYSLLAEKTPCTFAVWLRHPVSRLMSHYYYWVEYYSQNTAYGPPPKCVAEGWSFERFCLSEDFRNLQSEFLWGVPLCRFDFVGLTEHYQEDFERFSQIYLGASFEPLHTNVTSSKPEMNGLDSGLRREVEQFHALDMELYQEAMDRRERVTSGPVLPIAIIERAAVRNSDKAGSPVRY